MRTSTYYSKTGRRTSGRRTSTTNSHNGWSSNRWSTNNNRWGTSYGYNTTSSTSYSPNKFSNIREELQQRASSYRTLYSECSGPGKVTCFSPTTARTWVRYVNTGCRIYRWNNNDFCRQFGWQFSTCNPTSACRTLRQRYGTGIKAVARGKGNCWLIAASNTVSARPFTNYTWK